MKSFSLSFLFIFFSVSGFAQTDQIAPEKTGAELITFLQSNYSVTNPRGYNGARDAMYSSIDNTGGNISCVYTGYTIITSNRTDAFEKGINTEHVWPQSLFGQAEPLRGDIHHLYPTRVDVNGARSNFPFAEIPDEQTTRWYTNSTNQTSIPTSKIDDYSELLANTSFEPREDFKGNIARSVFYFWAIYQNNSNITSNSANEPFFNGMKDVLLEWHDADRVNQEEVQRSLGAEAAQGNKNPFVHDTTLVRRAFFGGIAVSNDLEPDSPTKIQLSQNYPNPFNPTTNIRYSIEVPGFITLKVYDMLGREVAVLVNGFKSTGTYTSSFDASRLSSGIYIYQLVSQDQILTRKMTFLK